MSLDINQVFADVVSAIKGEVKDDWSIVKDATNGFLLSKQGRIELLISLRMADEISDEFFKKRLADEKDILQSELSAVALISKVTAQNAANAALNVLQKAVETAIGTVL